MTDQTARTDRPETRTWPKAVIFDMDGLMYATEQQIRRAWDEVGPEICGEKLGHNIYHTMGMNRTLRVEYFEEHYGKDFPYKAFEEKYKARVAEMKRKEGIPVKDGLFRLLAYLSDQRIPMVLATGSSSEHTWENLALTKTPNVFREVICGDMVKAAKPDPYIYELACRRMNIQPEEALVLEDSRNGVRAAYAAGTPVIMIPDLQKDTGPVDSMYLEKMNSLNEVIPYLKRHRHMPSPHKEK